LTHIKCIYSKFFLCYLKCSLIQKISQVWQNRLVLCISLYGHTQFIPLSISYVIIYLFWTTNMIMHFAKGRDLYMHSKYSTSHSWPLICYELSHFKMYKMNLNPLRNFFFVVNYWICHVSIFTIAKTNFLRKMEL
jgi:hypothetical protein